MKHFFIFFISLFYFIKLSISNYNCDRNNPILTKNGCELTYCNESQFSSGDCSINNTIIKTQWLNNIILLNDYNVRFPNFAINSQGDMILECSVEEAKGISPVKERPAAMPIMLFSAIPQSKNLSG